jgi:hypothetical protein
VRHLRIVGDMTKALKRPGGEAAWPEPPEEFVHQLADEITELRRPAPMGGRFKLSFALVAAAALLLPLAAFADQAGDNLARREDSVEVQLVATDDDDDGGGDDSDSETSVAGAYDVGGDSDSESSGHVGEYDVGGGDDSESESDDGAAVAGGGDDSEDSESDDGAAADQAPVPPLQPTPALPPEAPGDGDDSDDGGAAGGGGGGDDSEDSD